MKNHYRFFCVFLFFFLRIDAQKTRDSLDFLTYKISENENYTYSKVKFSDLYKRLPFITMNTAKDMVNKEYYPFSMASMASTALLIPLDPIINKNSRGLGKKLGFDYNHSYKKLGPLKIIPQNANSLIYFLGNGTSVILMSGGFATYGFLCKDYRAQSVSFQLFQSILVSGIFTQTLKRITGRESPFIANEENRENSNWHLLPSFSAYQKETSRYDAMPSGHLTTGIAAWIIIAENYPEKKWIKPLGFTILGLMSFEMMQSGVHWISDYPIAILFGFLIGKNIAKSAIHKKSSLPENSKNKYKINFSSTSFLGYQTFGIEIKF